MLRKSLATLPPTLDQTYDRILIEIDEDDSMYAFRILQWLAFSTRPLTVEEVAEAAAVDPERDPAFERDEVLEDPLEALNICSSLVTMTVNSKDARMNPGQRVLALAHYSVQEYLLSDRIKQSHARQYSMQTVSSHCTIAKGCLGYLLQLQTPIVDFEETFQNSALALYSANSWMQHTHGAGEYIDEISQKAIDLFSVDSPSYQIWIRLFDPDFPWTRPKFRGWYEKRGTPLYYAAQTGLSSVVKLLLDKGVDINVQCGDDNSALQAATSRGYEHVARLLLVRGADVNIKGDVYGGWLINALQAASYKGHEQTVKLLLDHGAEVNAHGGAFGNALQGASTAGHYQVVKILLDHGADINMQGGEHINALHAACKFNNTEIVELLLSSKAVMKGCSEDGSTALNITASKGRVGMVKLLENGAYASANGLDPQFGTIVNLLAYYGFTDSIRFCHEKLGADLFLSEPCGRTPLLLAARGGHIDTFQYLVDQGLDPAAIDGKGDGLICYAAASGSLGILEAAFKTGLTGEDTEAPNKFPAVFETPHWTALHWACRAGSAALVERLLEKGLRSKCVTVSEPQSIWSPLAIAIFHGNEKMLEELSPSSRSLLGTRENTSQQRGKTHSNMRCTGCLYVGRILALNQLLANSEEGYLWSMVQLPGLSGFLLLFHVQAIYRQSARGTRLDFILAQLIAATYYNPVDLAVLEPQNGIDSDR
jgi:ankyrin repeat protein